MKIYRFDAIADGQALPAVCAFSTAPNGANLPEATRNLDGASITWTASNDAIMELTDDVPGITGAPIAAVRDGLASLGYYIIDARISVQRSTVPR